MSLSQARRVCLYRGPSNSIPTVRSGDLCAGFWKEHSGQMVVVRISTLPVGPRHHHWEGSWKSPAWGTPLPDRAHLLCHDLYQPPTCKDDFLSSTSTQKLPFSPSSRLENCCPGSCSRDAERLQSCGDSYSSPIPPTHIVEAGFELTVLLRMTLNIRSFHLPLLSH